MADLSPVEVIQNRILDIQNKVDEGKTLTAEERNILNPMQESALTTTDQARLTEVREMLQEQQRNLSDAATRTSAVFRLSQLRADINMVNPAADDPFDGFNGHKPAKEPEPDNNSDDDAEGESTEEPKPTTDAKPTAGDKEKSGATGAPGAAPPAAGPAGAPPPSPRPTPAPAKAPKKPLTSEDLKADAVTAYHDVSNAVSTAAGVSADVAKDQAQRGYENLKTEFHGLVHPESAGEFAESAATLGTGAFAGFLGWKLLKKAWGYATESNENIGVINRTFRWLTALLATAGTLTGVVAAFNGAKWVKDHVTGKATAEATPAPETPTETDARNALATELGNKMKLFSGDLLTTPQTLTVKYNGKDLALSTGKNGLSVNGRVINMKAMDAVSLTPVSATMQTDGSIKLVLNDGIPTILHIGSKEEHPELHQDTVTPADLAEIISALERNGSYVKHNAKSGRNITYTYGDAPAPVADATPSPAASADATPRPRGPSRESDIAKYERDPNGTMAA